MTPELELRVFDEFYEGDEQPPRMRSVDYEALQQDTRDLLLYTLCVSLSEQIKHGAGEVVRVTVRVT